MPDPQLIISRLGMTELDTEGGLWSQSWRDSSCSAIYYLLVAPDFSALHRLDRLEIYSYHAGAPVQLFLFDGGHVHRPVLGPELTTGQRPQVVVPAGVWQASRPLGEWSLMGTVVVPPYTDDCVEFGKASVLSAEYPSDVTLIESLCRS